MLRKKFYCGNNLELPKNYYRRGSRQECLNRGIGVGMKLKEEQNNNMNSNQIIKQKIESLKEEAKEYKMLKEEKIDEMHSKNNLNPTFLNEKEYILFFKENFQDAKSISKDLDEVFYNIYRLWKIKKYLKKSKAKSVQELLNNDYNDDFNDSDDNSDDDSDDNDINNDYKEENDIIYYELKKPINLNIKNIEKDY